MKGKPEDIIDAEIVGEVTRVVVSPKDVPKAPRKRKKHAVNVKLKANGLEIEVDGVEVYALAMTGLRDVLRRMIVAGDESRKRKRAK